MTSTQEQEHLAITIVRGAFKDKLDKAGKPYLHHLMRVSNGAHDKLSNSPFNHDLDTVKIRTVGYLHDLLEDCYEWTEGALRTLFDDDVIDSVVALTRKPESESYKEYIERVLENKMAVVVKLADLEDNMDITRAEHFDDISIERLAKYHASYKKLIKYFRP